MPKPKPIDPSPTPWDHSTWGFYCDTCEKFFQLCWDGSVVPIGTDPDDPNTVIIKYVHNACGQDARYIGYDHNAKRPTCGLCGGEMPEGEEMFKYHGHSGPCPNLTAPLKQGCS